jgi:hypothetical protein
MKAEDYKFDGPMSAERKRFHASGGELHIEKPAYTGLASTFIEAGRELGYPEVDLNGNFTEGNILIQLYCIFPQPLGQNWKLI